MFPTIRKHRGGPRTPGPGRILTQGHSGQGQTHHCSTGRDIKDQLRLDKCSVCLEETGKQMLSPGRPSTCKTHRRQEKKGANLGNQEAQVFLSSSDRDSGCPFLQALPQPPTLIPRPSEPHTEKPPCLPAQLQHSPSERPKHLPDPHAQSPWLRLLQTPGPLSPPPRLLRQSCL